MMIRIEVQTRRGHPMHALGADFDEQGGTIGRLENNTLVLHDPEKHISRQQAFISFHGGSCLLRDNGSGLPTVVNGNPVGKGNEVPLRPGDQIEIGDYVLAVRLVPAPFASDGAHGTKDAFDRVEHPFSPEPPRRPPADVIPHAFDLIAESSRRRMPPEAEDESHLIGRSSENLNSVFKLDDPELIRALEENTPASGNGLDARPSSGKHPLGFDLPPRDPGPAQQRDDGHILSTSMPIPEPVLPPLEKAESGGDAFSRSPRTAASETRSRIDVAPFRPQRGYDEAAPHQTDTEALVRAFVAGLGMEQLQLAKGLTPEFMNLVGQLLRESVSGTRELLDARGLTKREMRVRDITILRPEKNNPLKQSSTVSVEAALTMLLGPAVKGFLPPVTAMRDAFQDLHSHHIGVMAGVRAALGGVLERFDPARLEERIERRGKIDAFISGGRKARLWEMFERLYTELSKEAEDDFEALFGNAFLKAYEAQIAQLKQKDRKD
jgi:type VI secretion system FHA domain protein